MNDQLRFAPDRIEVTAGETVTWTNVGTVAHTVTTDPAKAVDTSHAKVPAEAQPWDSGLIEGGKTFSRKLDVPGEYLYFCIPHETAGMLGTVVVREN